MKKMRILFVVLFTVVFLFVLLYFYRFHIFYNFRTVSDGKFYKSSAMPKDKLIEVFKKYKIKTVIDFRKPDNKNKEEGKETEADIETEELVCSENNVKHIRLPSTQVPNDETVEKFLKILDNKENYPVLVHCYHGVGRAWLFSAIYLIEYENWDNDKARKRTRLITFRSSFSKDSSKGKYLLNYVPRKRRGSEK